jgi:UDP-glucose 4-epimerase
MNVLVVGGAGYIGSCMLKALARAGHQSVTLDNLTTGHREAVRWGRFIEGDMSDAALLAKVFQEGRFDAVMHFAAASLVGESVADPAKYYSNNVAATLVLLDAMRRNGVDRMVFSSTAAIFGEPAQALIDESHPQQPLNPYGWSKLFVERILRDCDAAYGLRSVSLRYFNAAGADAEGEAGELHEPETHLLPLVLQAASGRRPAISIYGTGYPTPDGTCVRDYVHVDDLCSAHLLALQQLAGGGATAAYNLGNGNGYSVREIVETARRVTGRDFQVNELPPRPGDPARLVADASLARSELGWSPKRSALETIISDAWKWECAQGVPA